MMLPHTAYPSESDQAVLIRLEGGMFPGRELQINCTSQQYLDGIEAYKEGAMIQDAFSFLTVAEREFLLTGMTQAEWDAMGDGED